MATPNIAPFNKYIGNGATTQFSVGFPYISTNYVHVYIKRSGSSQEELSNSDWEWVNETTIRFPATGSSEAVLADGDVLVVQRETPTENEFTFANQKRLFPEDVMKADDLDMQILQEQTRELGRAVKVEPTSSVNPAELVQEVERVYDSIDNVDTVANNISKVNTVSSNISKVTTVANSISNVNKVGNDIAKVNNVANNIAAVNNCSNNMSAIQAGPENAQAAAASATTARIWAEGDDEEVEAIGGTHSSLTSAGLSYAYAVAPEGTPVEAFAANHDVVVQGEKGDTGPQGPPGPKGDPGSGMQAVVVQELPASGESGNIYLVPKETSEQNNVYDEWIWAIVEQPSTYGWELIGTTKVDLSGYVPTSTTVNGQALSSNVTLTSDDITYTSGGTNCTYVFDLFLTAMESLGDSIGGAFDSSGTFSKSSYKPSGSSVLNNIADTDEITGAIGLCDKSIGKLSTLTTTAKTDCVSAINEIGGIIGDIETALNTINSGS